MDDKEMEPDAQDDEILHIETASDAMTGTHNPMYFLRRYDSGVGDNSVPLWLVTFTDVIALMLTFFVLLYSMSVPEKDKWEKVSAALSGNFTKEFADPYNAGSQDAVEVNKIPKSRALDLRYLKTIVTRYMDERNIKNVLIFQNADRLVISLPSELLFESGKADVKLEGKKVLFSLGGILSRIRNRVEIIGHTDPLGVNPNSGFSDNWGLSLTRGMSVAAVLREVGYDRDLTVRGLSSGRFSELPTTISEETRYDISRRVDIVLMDDDGYRIGGHTFK